MTCSQAAAKAATQGIAVAHASSIAYVQCQNLKYNAIIIGWLGVIISSVMIFSSMMIINMKTDVEVMIKQVMLLDATDKEVQLLMNLLAAFSTVAYGMSLINLGVSLLLLIGVARDSSSLMYPWLIYHGVVFGFALYLGIFYAMTGLFIDLSKFLMCLLVFALVLVIYYKIYHEVFTLFRVMQENLLRSKQLDHAYASGLPYPPLYYPSFPFKQ
ncbi:GH21633 [Drosophila grimshawi]|uniref:GH21633 n=1 Tax=Drosophila grimshawi TaxID=7222 RepID=B4J5E6_DROGR|nr:GH21633 [Drosophila grimshawi]